MRVVFSPASHVLFAGMRAGNSRNGFDGVLLNSSVVHGEGRAPEVPVTESAWCSYRTRIYIPGIYIYISVGYIALHTEVLSY